VKRLLTVGVVAAVAVFAVSSPVSAVPLEQRGTPVAITASVTPKRDSTRPYRFMTRGAVTLPPRFCAPAETTGPVGSPGNCLPLNCPAGVTDARYCAPLTFADACFGQLQIRFARNSRAYSSQLVTLRSDCTYKARATLNSFATRGKVTVTAVFLGNRFLKRRAATPRTVRVGPVIG